MAGEHSPLIWTESDALAEVISAESGHIVLETCPPDYVEKISWYLGSHGGQSRQGEVPDEPAEAESDSGDSLFITQKSVPEPERSGRRRRRCSLWSQPTSPGDLEESDGDTSSSASLGEPITDRESRREKHALPKYSFPFLTERRWKPSSTLLPARQNISLHNSAMGGFFKCVREMWQGHQRGEDVQSSLPTVDMEGEYISPLSEEEGERSEDEDIKVVERKRFVAPSKAKSQQTWCNQLQQQTSRRAGQETSREPRKTLHATPLKATLSRVTLESAHAESSDEGDSSSRVLERERKDEHITGDGNLLARAETPMTKQPQQKAAEEELRDYSDAAVCEPHTPQRSPRQYTQVSRDAPATVTEPQTEVFHTDEPGSQNLLHSLPDLTSDTNDDSVCSWTGVKRKKKKKKAKGDHESAEEQKGQGPVEPEGQHAATSANVDETPSLCEDNRAEPPASQTCDELEFNEENWVENQEERDITESKPKKKKKKKKKLTAENVRQEGDGSFESDVRMEDSVFSASCDVETGGREEEKKKKKKKKKKRKRSGEDVEQLQSSAVTEPPNDAAEIQKKKKKRKKEERVAITAEPEEEEASNRTSDLPPVSTGQVDESGNDLENHAASQETLETSYVKRKKHKKKQRSSSNDDAAEDGEEGVHVSLSNGAVTLAESSGMSLKKKKKKKKKTISEGVDISSTPEGNETVENIDDAQKTKEDLEDQNAELTKKRKEKKNKSEMSNRSISEDTVAQSDDSASVREKEKRRTSSFPVADAEENDAQTHGEQSSPRSADAGVRKKRRKRKVSAAPDDVEKDHERDFEEPNKTCQSALPEATDAVVKRKKKRAGNESETVLESLESAADAEHSPSDEAAILKKKKKKKKKKKCKDEPCHVIQESPPSKKGKQLDFPNGSTSDHAAKETLNTVEHASPSPETPRNQAAKDVREKKKKKKMESAENVLPEGKSLTKSEPQGNTKKERNKQSAVPNIMSSSPVLSETSLDVTKNKHRAVRRRLHNPSEDLLTDSV